MADNTHTTSRATQPLTNAFEGYLQGRAKGRDGESGNYRRNASRELGRFAEWTSGSRGSDSWSGVVPNADRDPAFADLDERVFREYARHLATEALDTVDG